jgi:hypothetical protein
MTTEKSSEIHLPTAELNRLMSVPGICDEEFNTRAYRLLSEFHELTALKTRIELRFCLPEPPVNFLHKNDTCSNSIREVYLYHGSTEVTTRTQERLSTYPSNVLRGLVKTTFEGQAGFVFVTDKIEIGKSEAVFAPPQHKPIIHSWTFLK